VRGSREASPDGFFPSGVFLKMKTVVQHRRTNAFLGADGKWIRRIDHARAFATSLEALRFCVERQLKEVDMLVCYPGSRSNLRLPLY
jgi:hypothetical protein